MSQGRYRTRGIIKEVKANRFLFVLLYCFGPDGSSHPLICSGNMALSSVICFLKEGSFSLFTFKTKSSSLFGCWILSKEGLPILVQYNEKKVFDVKLKEMKSALTTQIAEGTEVSEVIDTVKQCVKDANLPDVEVVRILWDVIMDAVQWSGKNQQQNANAALRQVRTKNFKFF